MPKWEKTYRCLTRVGKAFVSGAEGKEFRETSITADKHKGAGSWETWGKLVAQCPSVTGMDLES